MHDLLKLDASSIAMLGKQRRVISAGPIRRAQLVQHLADRVEVAGCVPNIYWYFCVPLCNERHALNFDGLSSSLRYSISSGCFAATPAK
jgi:hypothetical protein